MTSSFFVPRTSAEITKLEQSVLILPIPSIGAVAQLAADVLITKYDLELVGYLDSKYHVPIVGGQEKGHGICTAVDVYHSSKNGITIVLQRSPPLKAHADAFADELATWSSSVGFKDALVVTGIGAETRTDTELQETSSLVRTWCGRERDRALCEKFGVPRYVGNVIGSRAGEDDKEDKAMPPAMPHSGTASRVIGALYSKGGNAVRICLIGMFVSGTDEEAGHELGEVLGRGIVAQRI